jgi:hypothetical protein
MPGGVDLWKFDSVTYTRVQSVMLTGGHGTKLTVLTLVQGLQGALEAAVDHCIVDDM